MISLALWQEACARLDDGGAFLMAGDGKNPMTIGWAQAGVVWGKPVLTVFVRGSRYSHALLDGGVFTVSFPHEGTMRRELGFCGSKSGRDTDKLAALNLTVSPAKAVPGSVLDGCAFHFECRELFRANSDLTKMDPAILARYYGGKTDETGDPHTILFGEILAAYRTEA